MTLRYLPVCCFVLLLALQAVESFPLRTGLQKLNRQEMAHAQLLNRHLVEFIPFICGHQGDFPVQLTRKFCSANIQLHRRQEEDEDEQQQQQEQREKRVGWTISV